ncbi:exodeoxyribonuclease III protein [Neisseria shayeganii 871]|uniref:Exodeoxyribonuclease III protein n=1 Tax=Neisseria shayeganii 871 TaxID=1032488 RepID=G4CL65_9NEIS|nr:exodeoxyribonuclease III protein [Neisseria shayeganii 871]
MKRRTGLYGEAPNHPARFLEACCIPAEKRICLILPHFLDFRDGGWPKWRRYSRENWLALS